MAAAKRKAPVGGFDDSEDEKELGAKRPCVVGDEDLMGDESLAPAAAAGAAGGGGGAEERLPLEAMTTEQKVMYGRECCEKALELLKRVKAMFDAGRWDVKGSHVCEGEDLVDMMWLLDTMVSICTGDGGS